MNWKDMLEDKDHAPFEVAPKMQKDVDTLKAMFKSFDEALRSGIDYTRIRPEHHDGKSTTQEIAPGFTMVSIEHGAFRGLTICPDCCRRAVMFYRDAANFLETLATEAEKRRGDDK